RGTPSRGQRSSASAKASCAHSPARSQSRVIRISVATTRPHSVRNAPASAASTSWLTPPRTASPRSPRTWRRDAWTPPRSPRRDPRTRSRRSRRSAPWSRRTARRTAPPRRPAGGPWWRRCRAAGATRRGARHGAASPPPTAPPSAPPESPRQRRQRRSAACTAWFLLWSRGSRRSGRLDDQEAVPVDVAEEELRRHGIRDGGLDRDQPRPGPPRARDLRVHVDAAGAQRCVVGLDVLGRERATRLVAAGGPTLARRDQRNRDRRARRGHLDPAAAFAVGEVGARPGP